MAPGIRASAIYKKKDGNLTISKDQKSVIWQPVASGADVKIAVADITSGFSNILRTCYDADSYQIFNRLQRLPRR